MSKPFQIASPDAEAAQQGLVAPSSAAGEPASGRPAVAALLRALRPKQWAKNVLVAAAPAAAGVLTQSGPAGKTALAFVAFCLVSSAAYLVNDVGDVEADRQHPVKSTRPIAAGQVSIRAAMAAAAVLLVAGLGVAAAVRGGFFALLAGYVLMMVSYTLWLKHMAVLDIAVVASGFIVRAVAGGLAVDVPISRWFLIVASFGSLFMVAGKRYSEHVTMGAERETVRATLATYSSGYLRYVWTMASGVTLLSYCLWAFEQSRLESSVPWFELSIVPFAVAILRYALLLEEGHGGAPEDIVLGDRPLQVLGLVWLVIWGAGVSVVH
ncbi:MAG: decaprenyl-phosphate phosphoribosyltransferase [Solirubrobacteraceae bacterium]